MSLSAVRDSDWDRLILGGVVWPGVCAVATSNSRDIQTAKQKRKDGVTLTDNGNVASPVRVTLTIWEQDQLDELDRILPNFSPRKPGGIRTPLDIAHPATRLLGIKQVYLKGIAISNPNKGLLRLDMDLIEWFPAAAVAKVRSKGKPKGIDGHNKRGEYSDSDFDVPPPSDNVGANL